MNSDEEDIGGIDIHVEYTDETGNSDELLVEVKNLGDYSLSKKDYDKLVKNRFEDLDPDNIKKRSLAIPQHQTKYKNIRDECPKDNITVIPMDQQITGDVINNNKVKSSFKDFKGKFDSYIDGIVPDINKGNTESIEDDLRLGKEPKIVANKWGKSEGYVYNISSKLDLPDRREKAWKRIRHIKYVEI